MFCDQCGARIAKSSTFCDQCGANVREKDKISSSEGQAEAPRQSPALLLVVVLALGIGGYFVYSDYSEKFLETQRELRETKEQLSEFRSSTTEALTSQQDELEEKDEELARVKQQERLLQNTVSELQTQQQNQQQVAQTSGSSLGNIAPAVVKVVCSRDARSDRLQSGSGTLFRAHGSDAPYAPYFVQTNLHVVTTTDGSTANCVIALYPDSSSSSSLFFFRSSSYRFYDTDTDLAYIKPEPVDDHPQSGSADILNTYALSDRLGRLCGSVEIGNRVSVLGFPGIGGSTLTVTDGIISGFETFGGIRYLKTSAKIDQGNSGGLVVKENDGCILGVPTFAQSGSIESIGRILDLDDFLR